MSYSKIKKYYFTACAVLFVLLLLLTLMRDGWTLTPQSLLSMLVGSFGFEAHLEAKYASYAKRRVKASQLAESGIERSYEGTDRMTWPEAIIVIFLAALMLVISWFCDHHHF